MTIDTKHYSYTPVVDQLQTATQITNLSTGEVISPAPLDKLLYCKMLARQDYFLTSPDIKSKERAYHDNIDQLADALGVSFSSLQRALKTLKAIGLVRVHSKKGVSNRWAVEPLTPETFLLEKKLKDGTLVDARFYNPFTGEVTEQKEERPALETSPPQRNQEPAQATKDLKSDKILNDLPVVVKPDVQEVGEYDNYPPASRAVLEDLRASNDNREELSAKVNSYVQDYTTRHIIRHDEEDAILMLIEKGCLQPDATKLISEIYQRRYSSAGVSNNTY